MKKRLLSMLLLFSLCLGFVSGCKDGNSGSVNPLSVEGNDVVLKVGEKNYTANDLFGDMLNSNLGAELVYERILKMVVEDTVDVDSHLEDSWEVQFEKFEDEVASYKASNGVDEEEAKAAVLKEKGYATVEEWKDQYYFENRLDQLQEEYWKIAYDGYYTDYLSARLPYYVKHALVKTAYTAESGAYSSQISEADATALYEVYEMLKEDEKFSYVINHLSEDTGSSSTGNGYMMDLTTSFVKEFLRGVFIFDSLLTNNTDKVAGLSDEVLDFFASSSTGYGFNVIKASDLELLGKYASSTSYQGITTYKNEKEEGSETIKEVSSSTITSDYGSSSSLYTRSIIFNQIFNNPGISVIEYDSTEDVPENTTQIVINGEPKTVLTDEYDNIIFVACARGDSSDLWIHFLTVNVSPFDAEIELFYSNPEKEEAIIKKLVDAEKTKLTNLGSMTAEEIAKAVEDYKAYLEDVKTYVDIVGGEKPTTRNEAIDEIEEKVKTYAKRGVTSGEVAGEDQYLTYDMLEYYMENKENGKIEIVNASIKNVLVNYMNSQRALIDYLSLQTIVDGWEEYSDLLQVLSSDDVTSRKIPLECSYAVNGTYRASTSTSLCKYNYETGFEILMTYTTNGGDYATDGEGNVVSYTKSFRLGQTDQIVLPELTRSGYTFGGWYYTEKCEEGTEIETREAVIDNKTVTVADYDLSKSSKDNKTQLFAKWIENTPGEGE